jgi:hypothetical protein
MNERTVLDDPLVAEVRAARAALFAAAGDNIHEFCRRAQERQRTSGHPVVSGTPKTSNDAIRTE